MEQSSTNRPSSKVARLIDEYDLNGLGAELEARWTRDDDRMSLRDLADFFNKRLLEQTLTDAGMNAVESNIETSYEHLTNDDVSTGVRTDTRNRLEQNGVDVEQLETDFVTYQAIRSFLKEWRDAEYQNPSDEEKLEKDLEAIQRLLTRTYSIIDDRLSKLETTNRLALGDFEILLDAQILCHECGTQSTVSELFEQGGCKCQK